MLKTGELTGTEWRRLCRSISRTFLAWGTLHTPTRSIPRFLFDPRPSFLNNQTHLLLE